MTDFDTDDARKVQALCGKMHAAYFVIQGACEEIEKLRAKLAAAEKELAATQTIMSQYARRAEAAEAKLAAFEDDRESLAERGEVLHERIEVLEKKLAQHQKEKFEDITGGRKLDRYREALLCIAAPLPEDYGWATKVARAALAGDKEGE